MEIHSLFQITRITEIEHKTKTKKTKSIKSFRFFRDFLFPGNFLEIFPFFVFHLKFSCKCLLCDNYSILRTTIQHKNEQTNPLPAANSSICVMKEQFLDIELEPIAVREKSNFLNLNQSFEYFRSWKKIKIKTFAFSIDRSLVSSALIITTDK